MRPPVAENTYDTIGALCGYNKALHTLKIPLLALLRRSVKTTLHLADLIPVCLRLLEVYNDWFCPSSEMVDKVVQMLEQEDMVAMRQLTVSRSLSSEMEGRLWRACEEANVVFL